MVRMKAEGATLADIQDALAQGGLTMSRSGIRSALRRLGIDTARPDATG